MTGGALLCVAAAAADNATHTIVATVLNDKYAGIGCFYGGAAATTAATLLLLVYFQVVGKGKTAEA